MTTMRGFITTMRFFTAASELTAADRDLYFVYMIGAMSSHLTEQEFDSCRQLADKFMAERMSK
jgi:DNA-binding transcriptional regulator LsrR (DeoR family)